MSRKHRASPSGPIAKLSSDVVIDHGVIPGRSVAVATAALTEAQTTDTLVAVAVVPGAGPGGPLMVAGARVPSPGQAEVYVANINVGNFTTGSITFELTLTKFTS